MLLPQTYWDYGSEFSFSSPEADYMYLGFLSKGLQPVRIQLSECCVRCFLKHREEEMEETWRQVSAKFRCKNKSCAEVSFTLRFKGAITSSLMGTPTYRKK